MNIERTGERKKQRVLNLNPTNAPEGFHYEGEPVKWFEGKTSRRLRKDKDRPGSRESNKSRYWWEGFESHLYRAQERLWTGPHIRIFQARATFWPTRLPSNISTELSWDHQAPCVCCLYIHTKAWKYPNSGWDRHHWGGRFSRSQVPVRHPSFAKIDHSLDHLVATDDDDEDDS